jgi:hypothetical protein
MPKADLLERKRILLVDDEPDVLGEIPKTGGMRREVQPRSLISGALSGHLLGRYRAFSFPGQAISQGDRAKGVISITLFRAFFVFVNETRPWGLDFKGFFHIYVARRVSHHTGSFIAPNEIPYPFPEAIASCDGAVFQIDMLRANFLRTGGRGETEQHCEQEEDPCTLGHFFHFNVFLPSWIFSKKHTQPHFRGDDYKWLKTMLNFI